MIDLQCTYKYNNIELIPLDKTVVNLVTNSNYIYSIEPYDDLHYFLTLYTVDSATHLQEVNFTDADSTSQDKLTLKVRLHTEAIPANYFIGIKLPKPVSGNGRVIDIAYHHMYQYSTDGGNRTDNITSFTSHHNYTKESEVNIGNPDYYLNTKNYIEILYPTLSNDTMFDWSSQGNNKVNRISISGSPYKYNGNRVLHEDIANNEGTIVTKFDPQDTVITNSNRIELYGKSLDSTTDLDTYEALVIKGDSRINRNLGYSNDVINAKIIEDSIEIIDWISDSDIVLGHSNTSNVYILFLRLTKNNVGNRTNITQKFIFENSANIIVYIVSELLDEVTLSIFINDATVSAKALIIESKSSYLLNLNYTKES